MSRSIAMLAIAAALGLAPGAAGADPALEPASALHERLVLGRQRFDLAVDVAPPASGVVAISCEARVETALPLGATLVVRQPYTVSLGGARMVGSSRVEARRGLEIGPATLAMLDVTAEPLSRGLAPSARTRLEHRFTADSRAELALGVSTLPPGAAHDAHVVSGTLRFERRF